MLQDKIKCEWGIQKYIVIQSNLESSPVYILKVEKSVKYLGQTGIRTPDLVHPKHESYP